MDLLQDGQAEKRNLFSEYPTKYIVLFLICASHSSVSVCFRTFLGYRWWTKASWWHPVLSLAPGQQTQSARPQHLFWKCIFVLMQLIFWGSDLSILGFSHLLVCTVVQWNVRWTQQTAPSWTVSLGNAQDTPSNITSSPGASPCAQSHRAAFRPPRPLLYSNRRDAALPRPLPRAPFSPFQDNLPHLLGCLYVSWPFGNA